MSDRARVDGRRVRLSVLDRLLDDAPDRPHDRPASPSQILDDLRAGVHRDVEHLLNARRPWRSQAWPELARSPLGFGLTDFTAGAFNEEDARERLRGEIETVIRRFEPRLTHVDVRLVGTMSPLRSVLTLHIAALLLIDPVPEPISFDTLIDTTTADVTLRPGAEA